MAEVSINYAAVVVSAVAAMVIGFLWYGPMFGKMWVQLMGWDEASVAKMKEDFKKQGKSMNMQYFLSFVGSLVMAYVLSNALVFASTYTQTTGVSAGLMVGFFNWLGFVAPVTMGGVLWEGKSWKLWCFNNLYHLVVLVVMGLILALWK